jgi:carboxylesterase
VGRIQDYRRHLPYRISQVLLDGHGRDYQSFKASTWQDWSAAITREYEN